MEKNKRDLRSFTLYYNQMLQLLNYPKPVFDQIVIELPCLMGFRAEEVGTLHIDYLDFPNSDTFVLDAKKHVPFRVPLNLRVARHIEQTLNGRGEGYVLQNRSSAWKEKGKDRPIGSTSVWYIWRKWTLRAGLPNADDISPITGRRFFAAEWFYHQKLPLVSLQRILRHAHYEVTVKYVSSLVFYEDIKQDYARFDLEMQRAAMRTAMPSLASSREVAPSLASS